VDVVAQEYVGSFTVYNRLKEGGTVDMELQETFWAKLYGRVTDKFGVIWQLNLNNEESSY
jgi:PhnB protein